MTTDLIKTLEELYSIKGYWFPEHSKAYVDSLPQIISALKDAERMKMALEIIADECDCDCDVEQGHFCIKHEALNAIAAHSRHEGE